MRKHLFGAALMMCLVLVSGVAWAQITPIGDVTQYTGEQPNVVPDETAPFWGQSVSIEGNVYVLPGVYNTGSYYIQDATGGITFFFSGSLPGVTYGSIVQVSGTVGAFNGEIQINTPIPQVVGMGAEVVPTAYTINELLTDLSTIGTLVETIGTVTNVGSSNFFLFDGGDTIQVYIDSTTGIDIGTVDAGDQYKVISPNVVFQGEIELKPRFQTDLIENPTGDTVPVISNVDTDNWAPGSGDAVLVSASIVDDSMVQSASLFYRNDDGEGTGTFTSVPMSNTGGNTYAATIPAPHSMRQVDFYVQATDDGMQTVTNPGNAPDEFFTFAVGITSIYEIEYVHPDSLIQDSPLLGLAVNIRGVVTAGTGDTSAPSQFVVQEQEPWVSPLGGEPTSGWGGVFLYEGSGSQSLFRGDLVRIGGTVSEFANRLTEVLPHNPSAVYLESFGNDLPPPAYVPTRVLNDQVLTDGDGKLGEAWESTWIRTKVCKVVDTSTFDTNGEYEVSDLGGGLDTCTVDHFREFSYVPMVGDFIILEGFMYYAGGDFNIIPIADEFIITGLVGVEEEPLPQVLRAGGFTSIEPNPFNPMTKISFVVNREELTQLNIYDIRGQFVRSLVNDRLPAQEYVMTWDGTDAEGQRVSSGTYVARLRIGGELMQVRKLSMIK